MHGTAILSNAMPNSVGGVYKAKRAYLYSLATNRPSSRDVPKFSNGLNILASSLRPWQSYSPLLLAISLYAIDQSSYSVHVLGSELAVISIKVLA